MNGPLEGVRILDLSAHISGPFGTTMLAEQGADVIKVEPVAGGDGMRHSSPARRELSAMFAAFNRGKRSIALDIQTAEGAEALTILVGQSDVVVQNFRPGVIERLGFGWDKIQVINPSAILLSVNGFGATGSDAQRRAYDGIIQAESGLADMQCDVESREPRLVRTGLCDKLTAIVAAQAITAALFARERDPERRGSAVEVPMLDTAVWFLWPDTMVNQAFVGDDAPAPIEFEEHFRLRRTRDGYLMVVMNTQKEFDAVCAILDCPTLSQDARFATARARGVHLREVNEALAPLFAREETGPLFARLLAADVPVARVNRTAELAAIPQLRNRGVVIESEDPTGGAMLRATHPIQFSGTRQQPTGAVPLLGEHGRAILAANGYSEAQIDALAARGVIG